MREFVYFDLPWLRVTYRFSATPVTWLWISMTYGPKEDADA